MIRVGSMVMVVVAAMVAAACAPTPAQPIPPAPATAPPIPTPAPPVILSVVSTSDTHGHIERAPIFGGYVDILRRLRKEDGGVVLVDAGDMFQGTIAANETEGAACIRAFNALGYHGVAIGNHEFDYGPVGPALIASSASDDPRGALQAAIKLAKFPILASNLVEKASGERVSWPGVDPSVMTEIAGVKVGIIGAGSEALLRSTVSANV